MGLHLTGSSLTALNNAYVQLPAVGSVTPESYGAVGDGTTDDTAALQAAVATGKSVSLRKDKTYLLSGPLTLTGQKLLGNGATVKLRSQFSTTTTTATTATLTTVLTVADASNFRAGQSIVFVNGSSFDTSNRVIASISGNTITLTTGVGITASGTSTIYLSFVPFTLGNDSMVDDVKVDGNKAGWTFYRWQNTTIFSMTGSRALVRGVYANNCPGEGAVVYGSYNVVRDSVFTNLNGNGVHFSGATHPVCDNVTVDTANLDTTVGHADGCIIWSSTITDATVVNCFTNGGISGIGSIDSVDNSDCTIIGNTIRNPMTYAMDLVSPQEAPSRLVISGNRIYLNANTPLTISNTNSSPTVWPNQIILKGNYLSGPAGATLLSLLRVKKVTVEGNHFDLAAQTTGTGVGVSLSDGVNMRGNTFTGGQYGIVASSNPRLTIGGNHFYSQFTAAVNMSDASTSALIEGNFLTNDATASASYNGILARDRHIVRGNYVELTQGRSGIYPQNNAIVKDNTVRHGTATYSIRADGGTTGILFKDNEVDVAINNQGTNTESGTVVVT